MLRLNRLQFAITREDPELELSLLGTTPKGEALLVCSGGDTVLALAQALPDLRITTFDFNPVQIEHARKKSRAQAQLQNSETERGLCQTGNFESLFRQWRLFFNEFVLSPDETTKLFISEEGSCEFFSNPYWPVSFDLFFHDSLLRTMFGEPAIQHAPRGSYPRYFQAAFERGLRHSEFRDNPFLQHLFLGEFLKLPDYLRRPPKLDHLEFVTGTIFEVSDLSRFDLVQLSNIFDWSSEDEIRRLCAHLNATMKPGALVLVRQINNEVPVGDVLGSGFVVDEALSRELLEKDRSLFYSRIVVARRRL